MSDVFTHSTLVAEHQKRAIGTSEIQEAIEARQRSAVQIRAARAMLSELARHDIADPFLTPREIRRILPDFSDRVASTWSVFCPLLTGRIKKKRHCVRWKPAGQRKRRYSFKDIVEAFESRDFGPAVDEFQDKLGHWIWTNLLRRDVQKRLSKELVKRPALETVKDWNQNGHPAFANKPGKPQIITRYFWPEGARCRSREYVRVEDLDKAERFVADAQGDGQPDRRYWMEREESESLVYKTTLAKYSGHEHWNRRRKGVPHPAIGATIKTQLFKVIVNGKRVTQVWRWREHVMMVKEYENDPEQRKLWGTFKDFNAFGLSLAQVLRGVERGEVDTYDFPAVPGPGRHDEETRTHFFREHLKTLGKRVRERKKHVRPATVTVDNKSYCTGAEVVRRTGERDSYHSIWARSCEHLGGASFRSVPFEPYWPSSQNPVNVWDEEQTNRIALKLTGVDYATTALRSSSIGEAPAPSKSDTIELTCTREEAASATGRKPTTISNWAREHSGIVATRSPSGRALTFFIAKVHTVSAEKQRRINEANANARMEQIARRLAHEPKVRQSH